MGENIGDESDTIKLKSSESLEPAYCILMNRTLRKVDLIWLNYHAKPNFYHTMPPKTALPLNTFKTHPWIFKDTVTGERMHVKHCDVFWPHPSVIEPSAGHIKRYQVVIHFPVRTLQENAAWKVLKMCTSESILDSLEIPINLINELKLKFKLKKDS